jgi:hypothetical protein
MPTLCYGLAVSICPSSLTYTEPVKASIVPASKNVSMLESNNMLLMGCNIVEGEGTGMVIASGQSNQLSKIATQAGRDAPMTSLQVEIYRWVQVYAQSLLVTYHSLNETGLAWQRFSTCRNVSAGMCLSACVDIND